MKKTSVALLAQTIVTFDAGTHKAIKDGGDTYLLISSEENSGESPKAEPRGGENIEEAPIEETATAPAPMRQAPAQTQTTAPAGKYVEADLTQDKKTIPELMDILEEMGINPADFDGKNTNKKLRLLILDAQDGKIVNDEEDPAPVQQPAPTQTAPARGRGRGASAPAGPRQLTEDEVNGLDDGDMVIVKLDYGDETEGVDPDKLWEAEVVGWKVPDGDTDERLHVRFQEDGAEDFIRDGDVLYEYKVKI